MSKVIISREENISILSGIPGVAGAKGDTGDTGAIGPPGVLGPVVNECINGTFDIWQRGLDDDGSIPHGYVNVDRFRKRTEEPSDRMVQGVFPVEQTDVPGGPTNFLRYIITTPGNATWGRSLVKHSLLNGCRMYGGKSVILKFHVRGDAGKFVGTSAMTVTDGVTWDEAASGGGSFELTGEWQEIVDVINIPAIDATDTVTDINHIIFKIAFSSGTSWSSLNVPMQTGTFDIAEVEIYEGPTKQKIRRPTKEETLRKCLPFYTRFDADVTTIGSGFMSTDTLAKITVPGVQMIQVPAIAAGPLTTYNVKAGGLTAAVTSITPTSNSGALDISCVAIAATDHAAVLVKGIQMALDAEI